jgi:hypothetical protein
VSTNSNRFLKLLLAYEPSNFLIECPQIQPLNACKKVSVRSHIPYLLGAWGVSPIILGKCVSQASKPKERKYLWAITTILENQCFWHEQHTKRKKEELGAGATMEGEFWTVFGSIY